MLNILFRNKFKMYVPKGIVLIYEKYNRMKYLYMKVVICVFYRQQCMLASG